MAVVLQGLYGPLATYHDYHWVMRAAFFFMNSRYEGSRANAGLPLSMSRAKTTANSTGNLSRSIAAARETRSVLALCASHEVKT